MLPLESIKPKFSKSVHEETRAGPGRSDHLSKRLLADFCYDRFRLAVVEIGERWAVQRPRDANR